MYYSNKYNTSQKELEHLDFDFRVTVKPKKLYSSQCFYSVANQTIEVLNQVTMS